MPFKALIAEDVGPTWIVALRNAGGLSVEDELSTGPAGTKEMKKPKSTARKQPVPSGKHPSVC